MALIPITEEFDSPTGQYVNLDTANPVLLDELKGRQHVDLRSFYGDEISVPNFVYQLNLPMSTLDTLSMEDLEAMVVLRPKEPWTVGSTGLDVALGNRNTLRLTLAVGVNTTVSTTAAVDLAFSPDAELVASFAHFPGTSITSASSWIELEDADANTVQLSLAAAAAVDGPQAVTWTLADLDGVTHPTIVRLHIVATGIATLKLGGLRMLAPTWTATKHDQDTITQRLISIFDRDGTDPSDLMPKVWRSADTSGIDDPLPVDSRLAVNFYTGFMNAQNKITLFLRGRREDFLTQLDLDGTDSLEADGTPTFGENGFSLAQRGHQPDYGTAVYNPKEQADLDVQTQSNLDSQVQAELERLSDRISESWIEVTLWFGSIDGENKLVVGTTETPDAFTFPVELNADAQYLLTCDLEENSLRCIIYPLESSGAIDLEHPAFDTTALINNFLLKRRLGRIGWSINLSDGDAWVDSIRSRGLSFGEVITNNFQSFTPVEGARLYAGGSPTIRIPSLVTALRGAEIEVDVYNTKSADGSFKVQSGPLQGIQTNLNVYEDFEHTRIEFDLFYPSANLRSGQTLTAALVNERGYAIQLVLPSLIGDQWQRISMRPTQAINEQSGSYRFILLQPEGNSTWWIDNLDILQRTVAWSGRATYNDPWGRENNRWTEFLGHTNSEIDGVIFPERGVWTQIRGRVLTQNAVIDKVYTKPKYAELGRMVWNEDF